MSVERLARTLAAFELTVDLPGLLRQMDKVGCGQGQRRATLGGRWAPARSGGLVAGAAVCRVAAAAPPPLRSHPPCCCAAAVAMQNADGSVSYDAFRELLLSAGSGSAAGRQ